VFANPRDGFAYVANATSLHVTRDGGESWHREGPARNVTAFAAADGYAYLLSGNHRFERSRVGRDAWRILAPCLAELGGTLVPTGDGLVWAVCPSG
jgi:hypothetical protein